MLAGISNSSVAALLASRSLQNTGRVRGVTAVTPPTRLSSAPADRGLDRVWLGGSTALRDIGGTVDQLSKASNTLATAGSALDKIGALLDRVHEAFTGPAGDEEARQSAADAAIEQLDRVASTSRFGGHSLLDGSYVVTVPGRSIALPEISSTSLGAAVPGGSPLASVVSGGSNSLAAAGSARPAAEIVDRASAQVAAARAGLQQFRDQQLSPATSSVRLSLEDAPAAGPAGLASRGSAQTMALLLRAQAVVRPEDLRSSTAGSPSDHVIALAV